jgi:hypothetical protein
MPAKAVKSTAVVEGAVVTAVMKESFLPPPPPPERNGVSLLALKLVDRNMEVEEEEKGVEIT